MGCSLLVVSFAVHALELEPLPGLPAGVLAASVGGRPGGGAIINGSHAEAIANTDLPTGTWTYLAVTYDGSAVRFYVNARPVSTTGKTGDITTSTTRSRLAVIPSTASTLPASSTRSASTTALSTRARSSAT